jgi:phosphoenolpyruvate carboxykinase (ATP)
MLHAVYTGELGDAPMETDPVFGLQMITECHGVDSRLLRPQQAWPDPQAYTEQAYHLARLFAENFARYEQGLAPAVIGAGPSTDPIYRSTSTV